MTLFLLNRAAEAMALVMLGGPPLTAAILWLAAFRQSHAWRRWAGAAAVLVATGWLWLIFLARFIELPTPQ